ncbi:MAG: hypothetical protein ABIO80_08695 [Sphingomicrobium sp.]
MNDGPEWFRPRRYGYGSGRPLTWQGWALTAAMIAITAATAMWLGSRPLLLISIIFPIGVLFAVIAARTTRGGWRWRWGGDDD